MKYVYVIKSKKFVNKFYAGITANIENRIQEHNYGKLKNTEKHRP